MVLAECCALPEAAPARLSAVAGRKRPAMTAPQPWWTQADPYCLAVFAGQCICASCGRLVETMMCRDTDAMESEKWKELERRPRQPSQNPRHAD